MFKVSEVDILVTCRALDEGLNVPNANAAVIGASTRSTRQRIQRLGRVLRVAPGKEHADVATIFATDHERQLLEGEAEALNDVAETRWYRINL
jgi:superfamily II DNA or RNA helicase